MNLSEISAIHISVDNSTNPVHRYLLSPYRDMTVRDSPGGPEITYYAIMSYFCMPLKCLWTEESSLNVPLQSVSIQTWAGGYLWPFVAQHLSSAIPFLSLSFCLSLYLSLALLYRPSPSVCHHTMSTIFSIAVYSRRHCCMQLHVDECAFMHMYCICTYTHTNTAWHSFLLWQCAELRTATIQLELMNSMGARGRQREIWKAEVGPILQALWQRQYGYTEGPVNRNQHFSTEWSVSFPLNRTNLSFSFWIPYFWGIKVYKVIIRCTRLLGALSETKHAR